MNIIYKIKLFKLQKWENYLDYMEHLDLKNAVPLEVCDNEAILETTQDKLFTPIELHYELNNKYSLLKIAGEGDALSKACNLMVWLSDHTWYSGASIGWNPDNSLKILEYSFDMGFKKALCCRERAIVLADLLIAVGCKAYPICMKSAKNMAVHFTVHVFDEIAKKWILIDPSFNVIFKVENNFVNAYELRQALLEGKNFECHGYSFNHTKKCLDIYKELFIKQCMSNLSTWNDCSMEKRYLGRKYDWKTKKEFKTKLYIDFL